MDIKLAENIKAYRKNLGMTQEKLAEVFGVTVGAVHKWESGMSTPDLGLIVQMAEFFETSVDVLLGYNLQNDNLDKCLHRIWDALNNKDISGLEEAEKAIKKYPNSFEIIFHSASIYNMFGTELKKRDYLRRSIELAERAHMLIDQNKNPNINYMHIVSMMSLAYLGLEEYDKAVEIMQQNNPLGVLNPEIGNIMSIYLHKYDEALPTLQKAFLAAFSDITTIYLGLAQIYRVKTDIENERTILNWGVHFFESLQKGNSIGYLDKMIALTYILISESYIKDDIETCVKYLKKGLRKSREYDKAGVYDLNDFILKDASFGTAYDSLGKTAAESIDTVLKILDNKKFEKLYQQYKN